MDLLLPVGDGFAATAAASPDATAIHLVHEGVDISYGVLLRRCRQTARHLARLLGKGPEQAVGCLVDSGAEMVVAEMATFMAGGVLVPMDSTYPAERLCFMVADCDAAVVLVSKHDAEALKFKLTRSAAAAAAAAAGSDRPKKGPRIVVFEDLEAGNITDPQCDGGSGSAEAGGGDSDSDDGFNMFDDDEDDRDAREPATDPPAAAARDLAAAELPAVRLDAASHIVYTSGSTGVPKGIVCLHAGMAHYSAVAKNGVHGIGPGSRVLLASASTWDPSLGDIFPTLVGGATLCVAPRALVIHDLASALRTAKASHVFATPALWSLINAGPADLPDLKVVALGGEPIPSLIRSTWAAALTLINTYGVTEATICQTAVVVTPEIAVNNIGKPLEGCKVKIATEDGDGDGDGTGELLIGGVQVARGYLKCPEMTAEKFVRDPPDPLQPGLPGMAWVRTGDIATLAPDGAVLIIGRKDNQIKLRGFRIELEAIEAVLTQSKLVSSAFVVKGESPPRLVAYVTLTISEAAFSQGGECALRLHCSRQLPAHELPAQIIVLPAFPLTASGKASRKLLPPAPPLQARPVPDEGVLTEGMDEHKLRTPVERMVARVWEDVLGIPGIGPKDNFYELGGTSITQTRMIHELSKLLALSDSTKHAAFPADVDHVKVRFCGLQKKPRVRDYASLLEWAALAAPNRSREDAESFKGLVNAANAVVTGEELLARLDAEMPSDNDAAELAIDALNTAAKYGHCAVVKSLLQLQVCPDGRVTRTNKANSPLMIAALHDHVDVAELLVKAGAELQFVNSAQATAAHVATVNSAGVLRVVLEAGATGEVKDANKWTCLHHAAWAGNTASIEELLASGGSNRRENVQLNEKDRWSRTPLAWAIFNNRIDAADRLLRAGALLHASLESGRSRPQARHQRRTDNVWTGCLHMAVLNACTGADDCAMLRVLLKHRVPADERDGDGCTALHEAARYETPSGGRTPRGQLDAVRLLLEAGCPMDAVDDQGNTALHLAVAYGSGAVAEHLSGVGANATIMNCEGFVPVDTPVLEPAGSGGELDMADVDAAGPAAVETVETAGEALGGGSCPGASPAVAAAALADEAWNSYPSTGTMLQTASAGEIRVWENERWYPIVGWGKKLLPTDRAVWSSDDGRSELQQPSATKINPPSDDPPPAGCKWTRAWDHGGWFHAKDFPADFHPTMSKLDCVRRRCWTRGFAAAV